MTLECYHSHPQFYFLYFNKNSRKKKLFERKAEDTVRKKRKSLSIFHQICKRRKTKRAKDIDS